MILSVLLTAIVFLVPIFAGNLQELRQGKIKKVQNFKIMAEFTFKFGFNEFIWILQDSDRVNWQPHVEKSKPLNGNQILLNLDDYTTE